MKELLYIVNFKFSLWEKISFTFLFSFVKALLRSLSKQRPQSRLSKHGISSNFKQGT